jgi:hypothetical protein
VAKSVPGTKGSKGPEPKGKGKKGKDAYPEPAGLMAPWTTYEWQIWHLECGYSEDEVVDWMRFFKPQNAWWVDRGGITD